MDNQRVTKLWDLKTYGIESFISNHDTESQGYAAVVVNNNHIFQVWQNPLPYMHTHALAWEKKCKHINILSQVEAELQ